MLCPYTRIGFAIRHMTTLLNQIEARTKVMVTLSNVRPDDYFDVYRGQYGVEDTWRCSKRDAAASIRSASRSITMRANTYHMYGAARYIILDDVRQLPVKVTDIYRKITT